MAMMQTNKIGARQIKAARALLDWSQDNLAQAASLSIATIRKIELGHISRQTTMDIVRQAIEKAGLEFTEQEGIRRCAEDIAIYHGSGSMDALLDDIQKTVKRNPCEVMIVADSEIMSFSANKAAEHFLQMDYFTAMADMADMKCILTGGCDSFLGTSRIEVRAISKNYVDPMPFFVYGDKHATFVPGGGWGSTLKIISIRSIAGAQAARRQFYSMWNVATPPHLYTNSVAMKRLAIRN